MLNGKVRSREYSRIAWNFLIRGGRGSITVEVYYRLSLTLETTLRGRKIPCCVRFSCSRKPTINHLKDLLAKVSIKVSIHRLCTLHLFQMFPQISRTPDFKRQFLEKGAAYLWVFTLRIIIPSRISLSSKFCIRSAIIKE